LFLLYETKSTLAPMQSISRWGQTTDVYALIAQPLAMVYMTMSPLACRAEVGRAGAATPCRAGLLPSLRTPIPPTPSSLAGLIRRRR
jgi:hypothetical protein